MQHKPKKKFDSCGNPIGGIGIERFGLVEREYDDEEIQFSPVVSKLESKRASSPKMDPVEPEEKKRLIPPQEGLGLEPPLTPKTELVRSDSILMRMRTRLGLLPTKKLTDEEFRQKVKDKFDEGIALISNSESIEARDFVGAIARVKNETLGNLPALTQSSSDRERAMRIANSTYDYVNTLIHPPYKSAEAATTFQNNTRYYTRTYRVLAVACAALLVAGAILAAAFFGLPILVAAGKISAATAKLVYIGAPTLFGGAALVGTERLTKRDDDEAIKKATEAGVTFVQPRIREHNAKEHRRGKHR